MSEKSYGVKSIFYTIQGEGAWNGTAAVFLRFVGCNMWSGYEKDRERDSRRNESSCPLFCDTDFTKEESQRLTALEILEQIQSVGGACRFIVMTGGEPMLQADGPLCKVLQDAGYFVAMETNGTCSLEVFFTENVTVQNSPNWVCCSPKQSVDKLKLEKFHELKLVVPDYHPKDFKEFASRVYSINVAGKKGPSLFLQPEDGPRLKEATEIAVRWVMLNPEWRVGIQAHKVWGVE